MEPENNVLASSPFLDSLDALEAYFKSGERTKLKECLKYYNKHPGEFQQDFYRTPLNNENVEFQKKIQSILDEIHGSGYLSDEKRKALLNSNSIHDFLQKLSQNEVWQAKVPLKMLDDMRSKKIILGAIVCAVVPIVGLYLLDPTIFSAVSVLKALATSAIGLPVVGMAAALGVALYSFYENQSDKKKTFSERFLNNAFILSKASLNIISHGLMLASTAITAPIAGALSILASTLEAAKQIGIFIQYQRNKDKISNKPLTPRDLARNQATYLQHRNRLIINVVAAALLVGIGAAWIFAPAGIFLTIGAISAIVAVKIGQKIATKMTEKKINARLQKELESSSESETESPPSSYARLLEAGLAPEESASTKVVSQDLEIKPRPKTPETTETFPAQTGHEQALHHAAPTLTHH